MAATADISIMGCGWLGMPLADRFVKLGYRVKGSTTSTNKVNLLSEKQIQPYLLNLQDETLDQKLLEDFLDTRILILNIPPRLRSDSGASYLKQLELLLHALQNSQVSRVLFVSSTSVYPDFNRTVTEDDISYTDILEPRNMLLQAERMFQDREDWVTTIVRFGGLVGGDRQLGRFMAGKQHMPNGDAPVNLIHLEDCLNILVSIVQQEKWNQVYNACADEHPLRKEFYPAAALALGLEPPLFDDMQETHFKLISSQKLKNDLSYIFAYPDPMAFF
ncbi:SDR family oxidoreductase [Pontibacter vulgaris]|uniref:SDR family oxidoreductase n=1 Tax=Pontibacter vulgaris TaxID=2905679 RepID=UPI001FA6EBFA|nr:SDR family oxidoreductase [Pontibacter vulgaris]